MPRNWLDNLIGWFSPEWGAKRDAWRSVMEENRHYDAGSSSRLNANWSAVNQSAENTDRYSRDMVRARARDLERNSDMMNSIISPFVRNVVGKGFILQANTGRRDLDDSIETLWKQWCKKRNCDVTGTQSFNQILRMIVRRKKVDGGVLIIKRYTSGGVLPFKLQIFEVDELDSTQVPRHKGNKVVGGIEYNSFNAPVGYWIRQYAVDGFALIDPVFVPAKDVIFYFSKRRPSQLREMSDMAQSITRIRDANEFMVAVSVKQRIQACLSVFIKKVLPTTGIGRSGNAAGPQKSYEGKMLSPGMVTEMNAGDEAQVINPQGQSTDAGAFIKLLQRMIGAGQGLSYEATARDLTETNYSSARQGLIEDGMTYAEEDELLMDVMDEVYETFIISAVLCGAIQINDFWNQKDQYFMHSWVKPPKPWIDPGKEATATQIALQSGAKTYQQIAAENGRDWRQMIDETCEVLEYAKKKHGVDLGGVILGQTKADGLYEEEKEPEPSEAVQTEAPKEDAAPDAEGAGTESSSESGE